MRAIILDIALAIICLVLIFTLGATLARAQPAPCQALTDALAALQARWSERPLWTGHLADGRRIMVLAAVDGGTWTTLLISPDGIACGIAAGSRWEPGGGPAAGIGG